VRVSIVSILLSQLFVISSACILFCPARSVHSVNSVFRTWWVGWPRSRKKLVAEGGQTLPLSPCQLGQLGYFSSPSWQIKYRTKSSTRVKVPLEQALDETPRTSGQFCFFFSRLFQSVFWDQAWHIRPILNQAFVSNQEKILGFSLLLKQGKFPFRNSSSPCSHFPEGHSL